MEEEITAVLKEKEEVISINKALTSELEDLTEKLSASTSEIYDLKEDISALVSYSAKFFSFSFQHKCLTIDRMMPKSWAKMNSQWKKTYREKYSEFECIEWSWLLTSVEILHICIIRGILLTVND